MYWPSVASASTEVTEVQETSNRAAFWYNDKKQQQSGIKRTDASEGAHIRRIVMLCNAVVWPGNIYAGDIRDLFIVSCKWHRTRGIWCICVYIKQPLLSEHNKEHLCMCVRDSQTDASFTNNTLLKLFFFLFSKCKRKQLQVSFLSSFTDAQIKSTWTLKQPASPSSYSYKNCKNQALSLGSLKPNTGLCCNCRSSYPAKSIIIRFTTSGFRLL